MLSHSLFSAISFTCWSSCRTMSHDDAVFPGSGQFLEHTARFVVSAQVSLVRQFQTRQLRSAKPAGFDPLGILLKSHEKLPYRFGLGAYLESSHHAFPARNSEQMGMASLPSSVAWGNGCVRWKMSDDSGARWPPFWKSRRESSRILQ